MKLSNKQKNILETAKKMFFEQGYVETSMRDLATHLNLKAASIYSHFASKEEILAQICGSARKKIQEMMDEALKIDDVEERFMLYIRLHITNVLEDYISFEIYRKCWRVLDGDYTAFNLTYLGFITHIIREMFPNEEELDCYIPNATPYFLLETLNSIPKYLAHGEVDKEMIIKDFQHRIIHGFKQDAFS